ncbi:lipocalin [Lacinutrix sp. WUR7]|uniref:lipocalin family protein n=1 Tax=Lacinutrix sp. WUR7 TaxID=2653681 RepID=UPI00193E6F1D|nr:lipocalin family protein [Lacinutrix sp. WUR7]QRM88922.1 lipocalin [Lacinutrix sp. WUR7]
MKHLILCLLTVCLLSCGTTKTVRQSKKVIKGDWVIDNITYSEAGTYNVQLLGDASKECFEGSTWNFIPNNNTGTYTVNNTECTDGVRNFVFTIKEIDELTGLYDFLLKPTNEKNKSETNTGFRLNLAALSDTQMQWKQTVDLEGKPFTITINFSKL